MNTLHNLWRRRASWLVLLSLLVLCVTWYCAPLQSDEDDDDGLFPPELVQFVSLQPQPVFTGGGKDAWDEKIRERGWILREDNLWKLWYTGYNEARGGTRLLGYATSPDGIAWTRHPRNPIYTQHWVEDVMVVKHQGKYWMFAEGVDDLAQLLVSPDGLEWTRLGLLDIRTKDGQPLAPGPCGTPTAWLERDTCYLFYERNDIGIWLAASRDMKVWTNVQDEPVMSTGPGSYERDQIALNQIIQHRGRYYAYYHGSAKRGAAKGLWSTCVATSIDLVRWQKYHGNPLQPTAQNKSSGIVVHDGARFRLYTMHPAVHVHGPEK